MPKQFIQVESMFIQSLKKIKVMLKNYLLFFLLAFCAFNSKAQNIFIDKYGPGIAFAPFGGSVGVRQIFAEAPSFARPLLCRTSQRFSF